MANTKFNYSPFPNLNKTNYYFIKNSVINKINNQDNQKINLDKYSDIDIAPNDEKIAICNLNLITIRYFNLDKTINIDGFNPIWDFKNRLFYQINNTLYCYDNNKHYVIFESLDKLSFYITKNKQYIVIKDKDTNFINLKDLNLDKVELNKFPINNCSLFNQEDNWIILKDNQVFHNKNNNCETIFPFNDQVNFKNVEAFKDFLVFWVEINSDNFIWVYKDKQIIPIQNLDLAYNLTESINLNYYSRYYRFNYESPVTPPTLIEFDTVTLNSTILESEVIQDYNQNNYRMSTLQLPKCKQSITVVKSVNLIKPDKFIFRLKCHKFNIDNIKPIDKNTCLVLTEKLYEEECLEYLKNNLF